MAANSLQKRLEMAQEMEKYTGGSKAKRPQEVSLVEDGVLDLKRVRRAVLARVCVSAGRHVLMSLCCASCKLLLHSVWHKLCRALQDTNRWLLSLA